MFFFLQENVFSFRHMSFRDDDDKETQRVKENMDKMFKKVVLEELHERHSVQRF